jgi:hypothetical protein
MKHIFTATFVGIISRTTAYGHYLHIIPDFKRIGLSYNYHRA